MLLTRGMSNTLSVLLVFDTLERNLCIWEKMTRVTHFLPLSTTFNQEHKLIYINVKGPNIHLHSTSKTSSSQMKMY